MRILYRVIEEHKASFDYAFIAQKGETVSVGKEDHEMSEWFWCKNSTGLETWVPSTHIDIDGKTAVFNQPYNSVEHNAKPGETVQYLGESLGWIECLNKEWRSGGFPPLNWKESSPLGGARRPSRPRRISTPGCSTG